MSFPDDSSVTVSRAPWLVGALLAVSGLAWAGAPQLPASTWVQHTTRSGDDVLMCLSGMPFARKMRGKDRVVFAPVLASLAQADDPVLAWETAQLGLAGLKDHPALTSVTMALGALSGEDTAAAVLEAVAEANPADGCAQAAAAVAGKLAGDDARYGNRLAKAWIVSPSPQVASLMAERLLDQEEGDRAMAVIAQGLRQDPENVRLRRLRVQAALSGGGLARLAEVREDLESLWASGETDVGPTLRDARYQAGEMGDYLRLASELGAPLAGLDLSSDPTPLQTLRKHVGADTGQLVATLKTSEGDIRCALFVDEAPVTVANFVGLARGDQPWTDPETGQIADRPMYPGTRFHRVIKDFMVQGGDPLGSGVGGPGYRFHDEIHPSLHFDNAGRLAMANAGPGTNGGQFFITSQATPHLEGLHTIFGQCSPMRVVEEISMVPTDAQDLPTVDVVLHDVVFSTL